MIKIDLSTILPKRGGTYLLGVIPGLVFGLLIVFCEPIRTRTAIGNLNQIHPFNGYALLLLFLVLCLLIGQCFVMLAWTTELAIELLYRTQRYFLLRLTLGSSWLYKLMGRIQGMPPKPYFQRLWKPIMWARKKRWPAEIQPIWRCQNIAATRLLKHRYGLEVRHASSESTAAEMQAWLRVSGTFPSSVGEAIFGSRIVLACGLATLSALYAEPLLRTKYVITLATVLLLVSSLQTVFNTTSRIEPIRANLLRLRMLMEEILLVKPKDSKGPDAPIPETSFSVAATADDQSEQ